MSIDRASHVTDFVAPAEGRLDRAIVEQIPALSRAQARRLIEVPLSLPAYEATLKAAHTFNLLDARGAISVTERAAYIGRIRNLSRTVAQAYYDSRERLGFPMLASQEATA